MRTKLSFIVAILFYGNLLSIHLDTNFRVRLVTNPKESNGYLCWKAYENTSYRVKIYEKELVTSNSYQYYLLQDQSLKTNYTRIDDKFLHSNTIYFTVSTISTNGRDVLDSTNFVPMCNECESYNKLCSWECNGTTYSWNMNLLENPSQTTGFYQLNQLYSYFNDELNTAIPYYEAMTTSTFNNRKNSNYYKSSYGYNQDLFNNLIWKYTRTNITSDQQIKDAQNNVLTGNVVFVGKKAMQYTPLLDITTNNLLTNQNDCSNSLNTAISTYNSYSQTTLPLQLGCQLAYSPNSGGGGVTNGGRPPHDGEANVSFLLYYLYRCNDNQTIYTFMPSFLSTFLSALPCEGAGLAQGSSSNWTPIDAVESNISKVIISRVDSKDSVYTLEANSIFNDGGYYVSNNINFPSGLYVASLLFEDGSMLPFTLEHDQDLNPVINNASFVDLTISPNPIVNDELKFEIQSERKMKFEIQILSLSGTILDNEQVAMDENTSLYRSIKVGNVNYPYHQLRVKLLFGDGSVLEETVSRP